MHKSRQRCGPGRRKSTPVEVAPDVSPTGPTLGTAYPHGGSCCGRERIPRVVRTTGYDYDSSFKRGNTFIYTASSSDERLEIRADVEEAAIDAPAQGSDVQERDQADENGQGREYIEVHGASIGHRARQRIG